MSTATLPVVGYAPTRPVDVVPHLQQVARMGRTICSIWPAALRAQRKHNGLTDYNLAAAPRGSYATLTVYDTQQWINIPNDRSYKGSIEPRPIPAEIIANDLVATWGNDTVGARSGYKPGIGIIAGDVPTPDELAALRSGQNNLFNWLITDANGKHMSGEGVNISDMHRMAAKEMLGNGAERLPWFPVIEFALLKECPACGKQTESKAKVCDKCHENIVDWYLKYNLDTTLDPVIDAFVKQNNLKKPQAVTVAAEVVSSVAATPEPDTQKDSRAAGQPKK